MQVFKRFSSALVADCLDELGATAQVMSPAIRLLVAPPGGVALVGRVRTLTFRLLEPADRFAAVPHERAVEQLRWREQWGLAPGDLVAIGFEGETPEVVVQGELVSIYYARLGVAGTVTDGYVRDLDGLAHLGFPVLARGTTPANGRGRLARVATGRPVVIGGVEVSEGDVIHADRDGAVVIPGRLVDDLPARLAAALDAEAASAEMVASGATLAEAFDAHRRL